jgi:hypothetical protein
MSVHGSDVMARFRYVGDRERLLLGPPVRVVSPGDILEAPVNPDPLLFSAVVERPAESPPSTPAPRAAPDPPAARRRAERGKP